ncbi:phage tail tube protein [Paenibacillus thailandensis]|uniref:Phage tail tube protein n=1 Tax=Paenibacillus thailandensis TaxID=393250 RepID=A0ABW5QSP7_9BACL
MSGILSKGTKLSYTSATVTTPTEIKDMLEVPEMGGDPEQVDVTTLANSVRQYIPGVKDYGDLAFTFLYDNSSATSNFRILKGLQESGETASFTLEYPDGTKHEFDAQVNVKMGSTAVNGALQFTATFYLQSDIDITDPV